MRTLKEATMRTLALYLVTIVLAAPAAAQRRDEAPVAKATAKATAVKPARVAIPGVAAAKRSGKPVRVRFAGRGRGRTHLLETVWTGSEGYTPGARYAAVLDRQGRLAKTKANRIALRNALMQGTELPGVSNPGSAAVHHVLCHILAMKRIVRVRLEGGGTAIGVEYVGAESDDRFGARLLYRQGGELVDVPLAEAPADREHVAFLEGSSQGKSVLADKGSGDTWAFWDVIKANYETPLTRGVKHVGGTVTEADGFTSALDGLMDIVSADARARQILQIGPRMRGQGPDSTGAYSHRQVLMGSIVGAGFVSAEEARGAVRASLIPPDVEAKLLGGTYDRATRLAFVKAVETLVERQPPTGGDPTVYGFARRAGDFDTTFQRGAAATNPSTSPITPPPSTSTGTNPITPPPSTSTGLLGRIFGRR